MDFLLTIINTHIQLSGVLYNILLEGSVSQILDLGLSYIFMIKKVNNSEKIFFSNFYITSKNNQGLYLKFETRFPRKRYWEDILDIWDTYKQYQLRNRCSKKII